MEYCFGNHTLLGQVLFYTAIQAITTQTITSERLLRFLKSIAENEKAAPHAVRLWMELNALGVALCTLPVRYPCIIWALKAAKSGKRGHQQIQVDGNHHYRNQTTSGLCQGLVS